MLVTSTEKLVIHDSDPKTFLIWVIAMSLILILYLVATTVHDIKRDQKIEEQKRLIEEEGASDGVENL